VRSAAVAQLNASIPNFFIHEIFDEFNEPWEKQIVTHPVGVVNRYLTRTVDLGINLSKICEAK